MSVSSGGGSWASEVRAPLVASRVLRTPEIPRLVPRRPRRRPPSTPPSTPTPPSPRRRPSLPLPPLLPPVPPPSPPDPQSSSAPSSAYDSGAHSLIAPLRGALLGSSGSSALDVLYASDAPIGGRPEPVRRPAFALKRCSWCARVTSHAQVREGFWLLRATFRCGGCAGDAPVPPRGATRTRGPRRLGRGPLPRHRGVLPRWPRDARDEADARERLAPSRGVRGASASRDTRSRWRRSRAPRCFRAAGARDARRDAPSARGRPNAVVIYAAVLRLPNVIIRVTTVRGWSDSLSSGTRRALCASGSCTTGTRRRRRTRS